MAGGTGDGSGADLLARNSIKEGEKRLVGASRSGQVNDRDWGMIAKARHLAGGNGLRGMAGPTHRVHEGRIGRERLTLPGP